MASPPGRSADLTGVQMYDQVVAAATDATSTAAVIDSASHAADVLQRLRELGNPPDEHVSEPSWRAAHVLLFSA